MKPVGPKREARLLSSFVIKKSKKTECIINWVITVGDRQEIADQDI
jgi:hypothetical protein